MITDSVQVKASEVKVYNYDIDNGMLVWMDCGGSNALKIAEQFHQGLKRDIVRMIVTTRTAEQGCKAHEKAEKIGEMYKVGKLPVVEFDFRKYEEVHGISPGDYFKALNPEMHNNIKSRLTPKQIIQAREDACSRFLRMIYQTMDGGGIPRNIPMFAAGGMALLSAEVVNSFYILNVHPGDLTKYSLDGTKRGRRVIVGDGWIPPARAIAAGHEFLYSSMHTMVPEMDAGPVHMRGYPIPIDYNRLMSKVDIRDPEILKQVGAAAQETLKHIGDHVIAGATFFDLFDGRWGMHEPTGMLAYKTGAVWHLAPNGIMIDDHERYRNGATPFKRSSEFIDGKVNEFYAEVEKISRG